MLINIKQHLIKVLTGLFLVLTMTALWLVQPVSAEENVVNVYVFEGEGCPHCAKALSFLHSLSDQDKRIVAHDFEVYSSLQNREYFAAFAEKLGIEAMYVPTIFIGDQSWVGFSDTIQAEIEQKIQFCLHNDCVDHGISILPGNIFPEPAVPVETPVLEEQPVVELPTETPPMDELPSGASRSGEFTIDVPFMGKINLAEQSLLLSTLLIAFVDGFNPCSIWVLSMLLAITLNTRSRKKVFIIGFVFIFVTALVYALFIGGLFTVFTFVGYLGWIQFIVALFALVFALVNIKDYFWYKEGVSFTISDKQKPGIYKGIRRIMSAEGNLWGLVSATVILAAGVSLVEFSCTAGFPVIWTNLLATQGVTGLAFLSFLLVYMLVYQLDEMVIFLVAVFTLRKGRMEEKYGRVLKLLGGMLMFALAVVMLIDPTLMNNIGSSLWVFGAAFGMTGLILLVHRVILPKIIQ